MIALSTPIEEKGMEEEMKGKVEGEGKRRYKQ